MSSARSNASAIQKRTQNFQSVNNPSKQSLQYPVEEKKMVTPIQAIIEMSEKIKLLNDDIEEFKLNNNNTEISSKLSIIEKNIENNNKTLGSQMLKSSDENKILKKRIEQLEKTTSDLQGLVNTLSNKFLSKE